MNVDISTSCHAQAAKTYLERKFEEFPSCDVDALLQHGLKVKTLSIFSVTSGILPRYLLFPLSRPASCIVASACVAVLHIARVALLDMLAGSQSRSHQSCFRACGARLLATGCRP